MGKESIWEFRHLILPVLVLLFFLGFYYLYEDGAFPKLKEISLGLKNYLPLGAEKDLGVEPGIPPEQETTFVSLKETIKKMQASGEKNCFAQYTPLPPLGEEKGTSIELVYDTISDEGDKGTFFTIRGGAEGLESIIPLGEALKGIQPCVIAGKGELGVPVPFEFFTALLNGAFPDSEEKTHYLSAKSISIQGTDEENVLSFNGGNQRLKLNPKPWLFTPDGKNICFFPVGDNDEKGLEEGIFDVKLGFKITGLRYLALPLCEGGENKIIYELPEYHQPPPPGTRVE